MTSIDFTTEESVNYILNYSEMLINEISTNPGIVSITWEHEKISKSDNEDSDEE